MPMAMNLYWALHEVVVGLTATGVHHQAPFTGFATFVEKLASEFVFAGGQLHFEHELVEVTTPSPGIADLRFANGVTHSSSTVVLNLPPHSAKKIGGVTPFTRPASEEARLAINLPFNDHVATAFIHYDDAWWVNLFKLTSGSIVTTEFVKNVRYSLANVICNPQCQGWLELRVAGEANAVFYRQAATDQTQTIVIVKNDIQGGSLLAQIHASLLLIHGSYFTQHGIDPKNISPPTVGILANWNSNTLGGWHWTLPSPLDPSTVLKLYQEPASNSKIYLVNEAYSPRNAWAEGSLIMAEKLLTRHFKLSKPDWLDPTWYNVWVEQDL